MDAATAYVRDDVMPEVRAVDGCVGLSMLADRDTGRCIVTTSWRTAELLGSAPELQEWEIAAMHRALDAVDRAVDAVRLSLMPKLDDLPGFCRVSVMARRDEGRTVAAISYDCRAHLEQASESARQFREEVAPAMGIEVLDSAEFDVVIAHLRVPGTV